eukprot:2903094-Rhodomonas_salina.1
MLHGNRHGRLPSLRLRLLLCLHLRARDSEKHALRSTGTQMAESRASAHRMPTLVSARKRFARAPS